MFKIFAAVEALQAGKSLANPNVWKQRQSALNTLVTVLGALRVFLPEQMQFTDADVMQIAEGVSLIGWGLVNWYLINATSTKVGIK